MTRPSVARVVPLLIVLAAAGACAPPPAAPPPAAPPPAAPPPAPPPPLPPVVERLHGGIDVSGHSGKVEWREVELEGHSFAFVKATEGVDLKDPAFDDHWRTMKSTGVVRGAYHFYVTEDDPEEQARFFISNVVLEPGDLAPVVDVELIGHGTPKGLAERLTTCLKTLEDHYGVKPIIYTSPKFWNAHVGEGFGAHPLWVAEYDVEEPTLPAGWSTWHLWQWKGDAAVRGVEKWADLSKVNRSGVDLSALVVPEAAAAR